MYAWASAIFWDFADPGKIIPALIFIGVALMLTRWKRAGKLLTIISASVFLMVAVLPLSSLLMVTLENRFLEPLELPSKVDGIILLGGSIDVSISILMLGRFKLFDCSNIIFTMYITLLILLYKHYSQ